MWLANMTYMSAVGWLIAVGAGAANAQFGTGGFRAQSVNRPYANGMRPGSVNSPYLNLLQPGSTAVNYYGLVRPQVQMGNALMGLQGEITNNQQAITGLQDQAQLPDTGHQTRFMNYGQFFMSTSGNPNAAGSLTTAARPAGAGATAGATAGRAPPRPGRGGAGR